MMYLGYAAIFVGVVLMAFAIYYIRSNQKFIKEYKTVKAETTQSSAALKAREFYRPSQNVLEKKKELSQKQKDFLKKIEEQISRQNEKEKSSSIEAENKTQNENPDIQQAGPDEKETILLPKVENNTEDEELTVIL